MWVELGPSLILASGTNAPELSITEALTPAVPLVWNLEGSILGRNSLTRFIITVFDTDERNSPAARERNCGSNSIFAAPDESISASFAGNSLAFSAKVYP